MAYMGFKALNVKLPKAKPPKPAGKRKGVRFTPKTGKKRAPKAATGPML
jgi:hypothetical protein